MVVVVMARSIRLNIASEALDLFGLVDLLDLMDVLVRCLAALSLLAVVVPACDLVSTRLRSGTTVNMQNIAVFS